MGRIVTLRVADEGLPPVKVAGVEAGRFHDRVALTWDEAGGADHYRVYRDDTLIADNVEATAFADDTVDPDTAYDSPGYQVAGVNAEGEGDWKRCWPRTRTSSGLAGYLGSRAGAKDHG